MSLSLSFSVHSRLVLLVACLAGLLTIASAQSRDDLPSAPSASSAASQPVAAPPKSSSAHAPQTGTVPDENAPQIRVDEPSESPNSKHAGGNAEAAAKSENGDEGGIRIPVAVNEVNVVF